MEKQYLKHSRFATIEEANDIVKQLILQYKDDTLRVLQEEVSDDEQINVYEDLKQKIDFIVITTINSIKYITIGLQDEDLEDLIIEDYQVGIDGKLLI